MKRHARTLPLFIIMVAMLAFAAPGYGALTKPTVTAPTNGGTFDTLPVFAWTPVAGADHYQFQLAADSGFALELQRLPHQERSSDADRAAAERHLLLARARGQCDRHRAVRLVGDAVDHPQLV